MALSGLFLVLFVIEHMIGNLLSILPDGGVTYNQYSHFMVTFMPLRIVEVVLFAAIIFHIAYALVITIRNKRSRAVGYKVSHANENSSWISRNMGFLGVLLVIFLVIHLSEFFASARITHNVESVVINGTEMHDMYGLLKAKFEVWWFSVIYLVAFGVLAAHLWHGFQSGMRTLGLRHPKYVPLFKAIGYFIAIVVPLGFAVVPLYFLINSVI